MEITAKCEFWARWLGVGWGIGLAKPGSRVQPQAEVGGCDLPNFCGGIPDFRHQACSMGDCTPQCGMLSSPPNDECLTVTENLSGVTLVLEYGREEGRHQPGREAGGTAIPVLFVIYGHPVHA